MLPLRPSRRLASGGALVTAHKHEIATASKPGEVAIILRHDGEPVAFVAGPPSEAMRTAWAILDSARLAMVKAHQRVPSFLGDALHALASGGYGVRGD